MDPAMPCFAIGLLSIGCAWVPLNVVLRRLRDVGYKTGPFDFSSADRYVGFLREYLKVRARYGWSAAPAHIVWIMALVGGGLIAGFVLELALG